MQLTPKGMEHLQLKLDELWTIRVCSACGATDWAVGPEIFELGPGATPLDLPCRILPVVAASCKGCGHTVLFSLVRLGLLDPVTGALVHGE